LDAPDVHNARETRHLEHRLAKVYL
jgi:hypothetical protein